MKTTGSLINMSTDDLSERIRVRYFETGRNNRGDIIKVTEQTRCELWAKVLPLTAKNFETTPERMNKITYRITVRYRTDIKPDDEILWRGRRLKLLSPPFDAESRKIFTVFDCEEVIENGET